MHHNSSSLIKYFIKYLCVWIEQKSINNKALADVDLARNNQNGISEVNKFIEFWFFD